MSEAPASITWRDEFLVGVARIDEQHRRLIDMLAGFYGALAEGEHSQTALGELLDGLLDYAQYHFSTEEELMRQSDYPRSPSHRDEHATFVAKATDMAGRFARGRLILSIEATAFIRDWLFNHILVADKELGRHLASYGLH